MKTKKTIFGYVAIATLISVLIIPFVNLFQLVSGNDSASAVNANYKIFANYDTANIAFGGDFNSFFLVLSSILAILLLLSALSFIVLYLLKKFDVIINKEINTLLKYISIAILAVSILFVISGFLATLLNHVETIANTYIEIAATTGYFLGFLTVVGGAFAVAATKK